MSGVHRTCPVSHRSNGHCASTVDCKREQWWIVPRRSQSAEVRGHQTCPVWHQTVQCSYRTMAPTVKSLQTPTGMLTWHTLDTEQCMSGAPPDCAHHQQSQPTARKWLQAINTPNHLHSKHTSILNFPFNTRAKPTTQRHIKSIQSTPSFQNRL
jgi:hypothetical protein